jgi:hypothetical protein
LYDSVSNDATIDDDDDDATIDDEGRPDRRHQDQGAACYLTFVAAAVGIQGAACYLTSVTAVVMNQEKIAEQQRQNKRPKANIRERCEETGQKERQWRSLQMLKPRRCLSCL